MDPQMSSVLKVLVFTEERGKMASGWGRSTRWSPETEEPRKIQKRALRQNPEGGGNIGGGFRSHFVLFLI